MHKEKNTFFAIVVSALILLPGISHAIPVPVDLSGWSEEGPGGGIWTVAADNNSVFQSVNSSTPTFFISDNPFINSTFTGDITVSSTAGDDDFIGFVFGYSKPFSGNGDASTDFDYILFDWKKSDQAGGAEEGFHLIRVLGDFSNNTIGHGSAASAFWDHDPADADAGEFTILDSNTTAGTGWVHGTTYDFELTYQDNLIEITLDGGAFSNQTIFSTAGTYTSGSFGFYNYSQPSVTYAGIGEEDAPNCTDDPTLPGCGGSVPEPTTLALMGLGLAGIGWKRRKAKAA